MVTSTDTRTPCRSGRLPERDCNATFKVRPTPNTWPLESQGSTAWAPTTRAALGPGKVHQWHPQPVVPTQSDRAPLQPVETSDWEPGQGQGDRGWPQVCAQVGGGGDGSGRRARVPPPPPGSGQVAPRPSNLRQAGPGGSQGRGGCVGAMGGEGTWWCRLGRGWVAVGCGRLRWVGPSGTTAVAGLACWCPHTFTSKTCWSGCRLRACTSVPWLGAGGCWFAAVLDPASHVGALNSRPQTS